MKEKVKPVKPVKRWRRVFSVSIFVRHDRAILLGMHKRLKKWLPPGGEVEVGEEPFQAAARELWEETGIERFSLAWLPVHPSGVAGPRGFILYEEHEAGVKNQISTVHMNFAFLVDVRSRDVSKPCDEFTEFKWFKGDEMELSSDATPSNVSKLVHYALSLSILRGRILRGRKR
jgi:8-oxo-dGTP pyrophosphatase MutT (NUDIX family)